ncbi:MAG: CYTH domain-containing protein [Bacteroidota bacterium]|nr:CYTH domain-containing protein [Bacteroidota bacterium]
MGKEIERKFLIKGNFSKSKKVYITQGYLKSENNNVVRVRISDKNAFITIKGKNKGIVRSEFEYKIPLEDAKEILTEFCENRIIEKCRYTVLYENFTWEIDEFLGENKGLIYAEIELKNENQIFEKPNWVGKEITGDSKYYNSNLIKIPFNKWDI